METKQVKEIIEIFEASNLSHMELEEGNLKIRLEKPTGPAQSIPVSQIAEELHFSDQASFCKFFKKHKKVTPMAYRRRENE